MIREQPATLLPDTDSTVERLTTANVAEVMDRISSNLQKQPKPKAVVQQSAFLSAYSKSGALRASARKAEIDLSLHYYWLSHVPGYAGRFQEAYEKSIEYLEIEARRRAVKGVSKAVGWYKGVPGAYEKQYSDRLLMFLLEANKPDKYRRRLDITGKDGGPIAISAPTIDLDRLPIEKRRQLLEIFEGEGVLSPEDERLIHDSIELVVVPDVRPLTICAMPDYDSELEIDDRYDDRSMLDAPLDDLGLTINDEWSLSW